MTTLLIPPNDGLIRCSRCFKIGESGAIHPQSGQKYCKACVRKIHPNLVSSYEWKVQKLLESTGGDRFAVAEQLNISQSLVNKIALQIQQRQSKVFQSPGVLVENDQGYKVRLSPEQKLVLDTLKSDRALLNCEYMAFTANELGLELVAVKQCVQFLKNNGFAILDAKERRNNLKNYVVQQAKTAKWKRSIFIQKVAEFACVQPSTVETIIKETGVTIKENNLRQLILDNLTFEEITLSELRQKISIGSNSAIATSIMQLSCMGLIEKRKDSKKGIFIKRKKR